MTDENEGVKLSYDERRKELTREVTAEKEDETTLWKITLKENGIKRIFDGLKNDKKDLQRALGRQEDLLSQLTKQESDVEKVELTEEQIKLKENIIALQKDDKYNNWKKKVDNTNEQLENIKNEIKEKNKLIQEIKNKARNLNLSDI
ncbi:hypothetical protein HYV50_03360 [Candidatus Pacearchaeota archaeon]|nr:hypothetical protein [Candidatus Pacearchaeota archaeon]